MDEVLDAVGERLRQIRRRRRMTLAQVAAGTGISASTLSRLESGRRRATLELLLPLSRHYGLPLDDLVAAPPVGDPRIHARPINRGGTVIVPLTQQPGPQQAYKMVLPPSRSTPHLCRHEGHEWLYVLSGTLRLVLGSREFLLGPGQAAEFDTRTPHWFGTTGDHPVEMISLLGVHGQRVHVATAGGDPASAEAGDPVEHGG